jgi:hypothetical protein
MGAVAHAEEVRSSRVLPALSSHAFPGGRSVAAGGVAYACLCWRCCLCLPMLAVLPMLAYAGGASGAGGVYAAGVAGRCWWY